MKQMLLIAVFALFFGVAQADDIKQATAPQAHAQVVSATSLTVGKDFKVSPSDYPNGVYVRVKEVFGERPVSASIFAAMLRERGFKIADKAEDADVVVLIRSGTFNFKDIDQNTDSVSAQKIDGVAGAAILAFATGGLSLLATDFSFLSNKKPVYSSMSVLFTATKNGETKEQETGLTGSVKVDGSVQGTRESFVLFSNEWFKMHLRNEDAAQPSSAVSPAKSLADAAEGKQDCHLRFIRTCCAMPAVTNWPRMGRTRVRYSTTWGTGIFSTPSVTPICLLNALRTSGRTRWS